VILVLDAMASFTWGVGSLTDNYTFGVMHFLQEERIYVSLLSRAASITSSAVAAVLIPKLGAKFAIGLGTVLGGFSHLAFIGLPGKGGAYAASAISSMGNALLAPARMMYLAAVLRSSEITRVQSTLSVAANALKAPAAPVFTALFYGDQARMSMGYVTAALLTFGLGLSVCWLPATPPSAATPAQAPQVRESSRDRMQVERAESAETETLLRLKSAAEPHTAERATE
jgi:hypothetical protein